MTEQIQKENLATVTNEPGQSNEPSQPAHGRSFTLKKMGVGGEARTERGFTPNIAYQIGSMGQGLGD